MSDFAPLISLAVSALLNFAIIYFAAPALVLNFEPEKQYLATRGRAVVSAILLTVAFLLGSGVSILAGASGAQSGCSIGLLPLLLGAIVFKVSYKTSFGLGVAISLILALIMVGIGIGLQFALGAALAAT
jgi:hypothetical protein